MSPKQKQLSDIFRNWRGGEVSRIEALSDIVYGFSLTLIVVSSEVPTSFNELSDIFLKLPAFAFCFSMLILCWFNSYQFHRRYGLEDSKTIFITVIQLFLILFYIYPLKFLFTLVTESYISPDNKAIEIAAEQIPYLFIFYGFGWAGIFTLFALLYKNALNRSKELELSDLEMEITKNYMMRHFYTAIIGLLSIVVSAIGIPIQGVVMYILAGNVYMLLTPVLIWKEAELKKLVKEKEKAAVAP
jgi:uncharacterized membrane protein